MSIKSISLILIATAFSVGMFMWSGLIWTGSTAYQQELGGIMHQAANGADLTITEGRSKALFEKAYVAFLKASLTGNPQANKQAQKAFDEALNVSANLPELWLLHASFNLKMHRLEAAKADLEQLSYRWDDPKVSALNADIAVQEGHYHTATASYQKINKEKKAWDVLAKLAYLNAKLGDVEEAGRLYQMAEDEISAKDMRDYAWVKLQRGYLALSRGNTDEAWDYYNEADHAYSGYWLTKDYLAEWFAVKKNFTAAALLYKQIIACTQRPEAYQALGDLYVYMGKPELAKPWHEHALGVYLNAAQRGEVQYFHHLASFYADVRLAGDKALHWAQKDIQLRQNVTTRDALAWALFRKGDYSAAVAEIRQALSFGWQDAHLFMHAGMIFLAAGLTETGQGYLQKALKLNPYYDAFHVHR